MQNEEATDTAERERMNLTEIVKEHKAKIAEVNEDCDAIVAQLSSTGTEEMNPDSDAEIKLAEKERDAELKELNGYYAEMYKQEQARMQTESHSSS